MTTITAFDNDWYGRIIEKFSPGGGGHYGSDAKMIGDGGRAVLVGFCVLAQAIDGLTKEVRGLKNAVTPAYAGGSQDAGGSHVESLTEAVMGATAGLTQIADAINNRG